MRLTTGSVNALFGSEKIKLSRKVVQVFEIAMHSSFILKGKCHDDIIVSISFRYTCYFQQSHSLFKEYTVVTLCISVSESLTVLGICDTDPFRLYKYVKVLLYSFIRDVKYWNCVSYLVFCTSLFET